MYGRDSDYTPRRQAERRIEKRSSVTITVLVLMILLCIFLLGILLLFMMPQWTGVLWNNLDNYAFMNGSLVRYEAKEVSSYHAYSDYLSQDVIYPGVYINGISVGGMTKEEALQKISENTTAAQKSFQVTIYAGDHSWQATPENVPVSNDAGETVLLAYAQGRWEDGTNLDETPFCRRCAKVASLRENPLFLTTECSYDKDAVKQLAKQIAAFVNREPVNAEIESFNYNKRSFTFTQSSPGCCIDEEELCQQICSAIEQWKNGVTVTAEISITEPAVTTQALQDGFGLISAYTTSTTSEKNRNTNIRLACEAINGTALLPGETFSFNQATGERTTEKGYLSAGAIAQGQSIEETGGGVCQVSSTLFNAVARANLTIVKRSPHAWPSSYVTIGQDATVDWPNLDFQFRNDTDSPVFIITYYQNRKVSAEIWGLTLGDGVTIDLESFITQTTSAPSEIKYVYNSSLSWGESQTTVKARDGYTVDTYQVWYQNGNETKRVKLYTSTYKPYQQVVEYNWDESY